MEASTVLLLLAWGTLAGVDLVSFPQAMFSRPLVAGVVAGIITGQLDAGLAAGIILELFALEVLPVGASRYPDYGPAAVAAACAGATAPGVLGLGPAVLAGLLTAQLGGLAMRWQRRLNARDVSQHAQRLDAGDVDTVRSLHFRGLARDILRSLAVTAAGLGAARVLVAIVPPVGGPGGAVVPAVLGVALASAALGAIRIGGARAGTGWLTAGLIGGAAWVLL